MTYAYDDFLDYPKEQIKSGWKSSAFGQILTDAEMDVILHCPEVARYFESTVTMFWGVPGMWIIGLTPDYPLLKWIKWFLYNVTLVCPEAYQVRPEGYYNKKGFVPKTFKISREHMVQVIKLTGSKFLDESQMIAVLNCMCATGASPTEAIIKCDLSPKNPTP